MRSGLLTTARGLVVALALAGSLAPVRAQDNKPPQLTPEQQKAQEKEKAFKKAKEDLEKELQAKKQDPAPAAAFLQMLAYSTLNLDVKDANDLVHKVLAKKIPWNDAQGAAYEKQTAATDQKTRKFDQKKFLTDFRKWISDWKPPVKESAPPGGGNSGR
jgi:hypothetical protein